MENHILRSALHAAWAALLVVDRTAAAAAAKALADTRGLEGPTNIILSQANKIAALTARNQELENAVADLQSRKELSNGLIDSGQIGHGGGPSGLQIGDVIAAQQANDRAVRGVSRANALAEAQTNQNNLQTFAPISVREGDAWRISMPNSVTIHFLHRVQE